MKLSIIIPILNEKHNIEKLIKLIFRSLKGLVYEIIFVDDNSLDGTFDLIKKIKNKKISFYVRKKKPDLTQACLLGISKAKYDYVLIMDGDLQHHPKYILKFIDAIKKKKIDIIVGIRDFSKRNQLSLLRYLGSMLLIFIINIFLGYKTLDPMSGYFLIKKKIFKKYGIKMYGKGYKILFDIIYSASDKLIIKDIKIKFYKRFKDKSKMSIKILFHLIISFFLKLLNFSKI
jgi:dolichol-phosphate mannosyltransferase